MLLVMEFVSNGCLRDYLKQNDSCDFSSAELLQFAREIAEVRFLNVYFIYYSSYQLSVFKI